MKNTGREYEAIVDSAFRKLLSMDKMNTITLERNVRIKGKSGMYHEIDIYWEHTIGLDPRSHIVIFEVKDRESRRIEQGEILKFKAVIDDIPGFPKGIFITRQGYQEGAEKIAKHHGIPIWVLREPIEEDWEGRIKTINLTYYIAQPSFDQRFILDNEWNVKQLNAMGLSDFKFVSGVNNNELYFYDHKHNKRENNFLDIQNKYLKYCYDNRLNDFAATHIFLEDTFMKTNEPLIPFLKLKGIEIEIKITEAVEALFRRLRYLHRASTLLNKKCL